MPRSFIRPRNSLSVAPKRRVRRSCWSSLTTCPARSAPDSTALTTTPSPLGSVENSNSSRRPAASASVNSTFCARSSSTCTCPGVTTVRETDRVRQARPDSPVFSRNSSSSAPKSRAKRSACPPVISCPRRSVPRATSPIGWCFAAGSGTKSNNSRSEARSLRFNSIPTARPARRPPVFGEPPVSLRPDSETRSRSMARSTAPGSSTNCETRVVAAGRPDRPVFSRNSSSFVPKVRSSSWRCVSVTCWPFFSVPVLTAVRQKRRSISSKENANNCCSDCTSSPVKRMLRSRSSVRSTSPGSRTT